MNNSNSMPGELAEAFEKEEAARAAFLKESEVVAARNKHLVSENARLAREVADKESALNSTVTHAVENSKRNTSVWQRATEILKSGAAAAAVIAILALGGWLAYSNWPSAKSVTTAETSEQIERRFADIANKVSSQRVISIERDVERLQKDTSALKTGFGELHEEVKKSKIDIMSSIQSVMERLNKTPALTSTPAVSSVETSRLAQVKAECLPEATHGVNFKDGSDGLSEEAFQQYLKGCRAVKEQSMRQAQGSVAPSSDQQVAAIDPDAESEGAEGDEPAALDGEAEGADANITGNFDKRTLASMDSPGLAQVNYTRPGFGRHGAGRGRGHGGRQVCPRGTTPAGSLGCRGRAVTDRAVTRHFDQIGGIKKGCVPGQRRQFMEDGIDAQGRKVRNLVVQRARCHHEDRSY
jgi:predicted negative regulator of RcsB-dependent stress response